jgi:hypothetical protein
MTTSTLPALTRAASTGDIVIDVRELSSACRNVSASIIGCYAEAASVMFNRFHDAVPAAGTVTLDEPRARRRGGARG